MQKNVRIEFKFSTAAWDDIRKYLSEESIRHILKLGGKAKLEAFVLSKKKLRKMISNVSTQDPYQ